MPTRAGHTDFACSSVPNVRWGLGHVGASLLPHATNIIGTPALAGCFYRHFYLSGRTLPIIGCNAIANGQCFLLVCYSLFRPIFLSILFENPHETELSLNLTHSIQNDYGSIMKNGQRHIEKKIKHKMTLKDLAHVALAHSLHNAISPRSWINTTYARFGKLNEGV